MITWYCLYLVASVITCNVFYSTKREKGNKNKHFQRINHCQRIKPSIVQDPEIIKKKKIKKMLEPSGKEHFYA